MAEIVTVKALEMRAKNVKHLMDKLNRASTGFTMDEIIRMALTGKEADDGEERTPGERS